MGDGPLSDLVTAAYACSFEERDWPAFFRRLALELGGVGGTFLVLDENKAATDNIAGYWGDAEKLYDEYMEEWHALDPQVDRAMSVDRTSVYVDTKYIDFSNPDVDRYMRWQIGRGGIKHHMTAVTLLGGGTRRAGLSIHRAADAGCTPAAEHRKLALLFPEIAGAMQLGFRHAELLQDAFWDGIVAGDPGQAGCLAGRIWPRHPANGRGLPPSYRG